MLQEQLLVFLLGERLAERVFHALYAAADDLHVGQDQVFVESSQIGQGVGAAIGGHHQHQAAAFTDQGQPGGVALVRAAEAGRVDQFQRGQRRLLRLVDFAQRSTRGSGMAAIALWAVCDRAGSGFTPVNHSNSVLLPDD